MFCVFLANTQRQEIDYFLPGIKPTGKPLELTVVGVVAFRGDKLTFEYVPCDSRTLIIDTQFLSSDTCT